ncbi:hypothetical protein [Kingella oralis]|uniref:hypothetical protein n=1 Tax=Kingella oralis TaxID=505 RepID=UPI0028EE40BE|nr:hypothetical protein [Kingella oralis]
MKWVSAQPKPPPQRRIRLPAPKHQRQPENPIMGFRLPLFARGLHILKRETAWLSSFH